jgi:hypothetical protein
MKLPRRKFLHLAAGAAALPAMPRIAMALDYPTRPVHILLGFPPGGSSDVIGRLLAQWLSQRLGQPFYLRQPTRRREQHRHRGGREGTPRRVHAFVGDIAERD